MSAQLVVLGVLVGIVAVVVVGGVLGWTLLPGVRGHGLAAVLLSIGGLLAVVGPWVLAAAALAGRVSAAVRRAPRDGSARLLSVATAGLAGHRGEWGAAMRAELESIDGPRERRRFARGCAWAALRQGSGRVSTVAVLGTALVFAAGTLVASRVGFGGDGQGILGWVTFGIPQLVLAGVGLWAARSTGSFRVGFETGMSAFLAAVIGYLAVVMPESAYWYHQAGVYVIDGDPPKGGPDATPALDPLAPIFLLPVLLLWSPCATIGAEIGVRLSQRRQTASPAPARATV
ncbi:hypothetical protein [Cellulomonas terrae]|uniref:Uncharacterized protein n=1 Tax=Cellulomonas terrae TaxID=311234 RepID=A0A511JK22_9CELL|nr:hypothetical protein [Cellulomonas terrae]GEL98003.1 hypothetical protein CTE05_15500 [Cellulomonas terrae]